MRVTCSNGMIRYIKMRWGPIIQDLVREDLDDVVLQNS